MAEQPKQPGDASREASYGEFVGLLARHDISIRRFVRSLLPASDEVDDIMQETALECWKKYSDFQPSSEGEASDEFVRWACVIARYKVLSWQRDRARDRLVFSDSIVEKLAETALSQLGQHESERLAVSECLRGLPDAQRRLVLSVHSPGQSIAKIAAETGEKTRRLYSTVNVLRKILLKCVQQRLTGEAEHG